MAFFKHLSKIPLRRKIVYLSLGILIVSTVNMISTHYKDNELVKLYPKEIQGPAYFETLEFLEYAGYEKGRDFFEENSICSIKVRKKLKYPLLVLLAENGLPIRFITNSNSQNSKRTLSIPGSFENIIHNFGRIKFFDIIVHLPSQEKPSFIPRNILCYKYENPQYLNVSEIEKELVEIIKMMDRITDVKVKIVPFKDGLFESQVEQATAIVMLDYRQSISGDQVDGIRSLVSGYVYGLKLENIKVVEPHGRSLCRQSLKDCELNQMLTSKLQRSVDEVYGSENITCFVSMYRSAKIVEKEKLLFVDVLLSHSSSFKEWDKIRNLAFENLDLDESGGDKIVFHNFKL